MKIHAALSICGVLVLTIGCMPLQSWAQNPTRVNLEAGGALQASAEENASTVLSQLNDAFFYSERPTFSNTHITPAGRRDVQARWAQAPFRCPATSLSRRLEARAADGYAVRRIPLEPIDEEGVLLLSADGRVEGFRFESEYQPPPNPDPAAEEEPAAPPTGMLVLRTQPSGAEVTIDIPSDSAGAMSGGRLRRTTPARFEGLPAREYTVSVQKDGYQPIQGAAFTVTADSTSTYELQLTSAPAILQIGRLPDDVTFRLDGATRPVRSGADIEVEPGRHRIEVEASYAALWDTTLTVDAGGISRVDVYLDRKQVPLQVRSNPSGATVEIDRQPAGQTPLRTTVDAGRTYELIVQKEGYVPSAPTRVTATPDTPIEQDLSLNPLRVESTAAGAQITNVRVGRAGGQVRMQYDLDGDAGKTYTVRLAILQADETPVPLDPGTVSGAVGEEVPPGPRKRVAIEQTLPPGATLMLTVVGTVAEKASMRPVVLRSALFPGLGQIYQGQPVRGWAFIVGGVATLAGAAFTTLQHQGAVNDYNDLRDQTTPQTLATLSPRGIEDRRLELNTLYDDVTSAETTRNIAFAALAGVWVVNLIDGAIGASGAPGPVYSNASMRVEQPRVRLAADGPRVRPTIALRIQF